MRIEDQCCSLELSKRLKELGVKQESAFYFVCNAGHCDTWKLYPRPNKWNRPITDYWLEGAFVSAFTCSELGEMLPKPKDESDPHTYITRREPDGRWQAWETEEGLYDKKGNHILADTEADARAKMLIFLIKSEIVKPAPEGEGRG